MLASIHPLGERARHNRFWITATAYIAGSVAGGVIAGGIAGAIGAVLGAMLSPGPVVVAWLAVLICLSAALLDTSGRRLPGARRQVDDDWLHRYRGWVYGAGFGFQLGLGVVTIVTTAAVYATFALAALTGSVGTGIMIGAIFGGARAATLPRLVTRCRPQWVEAAAPPPGGGRALCPHRHHRHPHRHGCSSDRRLVTSVQIDSERLRIDLPTGWEGEVYRTEAVPHREVNNHAVLHAATFQLPPERGDYGGRTRWR